VELPFPAYTGTGPYIFVSYSHKDSDIVFPAIQWLRDQGFNIWYDEGISPGASWREELAESILECDLFIILVSPRSANSDNCLKELNYALEHDRAVLAIHQEPTPLSPGLELTLSDRQAIFRYELTEDQYQDKVLSGVRSYIQQGQSVASTTPTTITGKSSRAPLIGAGFAVLAILVVGFLFTMNSMDEFKSSTSVEHQDELRSEEPGVDPSVEIEPKILYNSIAVLPFANFSPDPNNAYFAAGIHDEILNQLTKIRDLSVIARTSVMQYAGVNRPVTEIAAELNVTTIMEGSVRYADNRVRITILLIDGETGTDLWSEIYDRELEDIFAIQSDIASKITAALGNQFSDAERKLIEAPPTNNLDAYAHFLRATSALDQRMPIDQVLAMLDKAIELDPEFSLAYASRGVLTANLFNMPGLKVDPKTIRENKARSLADAQRALDLDPTQSRAIMVLSMLARFDLQFAEAAALAERAYSLSPKDSWIVSQLVSTSFDQRQFKRALVLNQEAAALDPASTSWPQRKAWFAWWEQDYQIASKAARQVNVMTPNNPLGYVLMGLAMAGLGDQDAVSKNASKALELSPRNTFRLGYPSIAMAYGLSGLEAEAQMMVDRLLLFSDEEYVTATSMMSAYLGAGNGDKAMEWLIKAHERNECAFDCWMVITHTEHPIFDPIRSHPRFQEFANKGQKTTGL
jgi:TolB-like protein